MSTHDSPPFVAVIMAGGKGQRFWPLSTTDKPKQFLDLEQTGETLIQRTFSRVLPLAGSANNIMVATAAQYVELVKEQLPHLPAQNILIEPVGRDSAPAVALASLTIRARYGNAVTGFFSSDHQIGNIEAFRDTIRRAIRLAEESAGIITIGIKPTRPATGYGYIEAGNPVGHSGYKVTTFAEKPNSVKAQQYIDAGNFSWNAGIFVWCSDSILEELDRYAPDLMRPLRAAFEAGTVAEVFPSLEKISIDFAVMEHTERAFVIPGDFAWDDIGDWVALERLIQQQTGEVSPNTVIGTHVGLETNGNIIYTEDREDVVVTLGVENLIIVKRGNAILLVHKDRIQDIKKVLEDERLQSFAVN